MAHTHTLVERLCRSLTVGRGARRAWLVVLWLLIATIGVLATAPAPAEVGLGWDKLNHAVAFAALALAAGLAHPHRPHLRITAWLALLGYGALIEGLQSLVPARTADWGDLLADAVGIAIGAALATAMSNTARTVVPANRARG